MYIKIYWEIEREYYGEGEDKDQPAIKRRNRDKGRDERVREGVEERHRVGSLWAWWWLWGAAEQQENWWCCRPTNWAPELQQIHIINGSGQCLLAPSMHSCCWCSSSYCSSSSSRCCSSCCSCCFSSCCPWVWKMEWKGFALLFLAEAALKCIYKIHGGGKCQFSFPSRSDSVPNSRKIKMHIPCKHTLSQIQIQTQRYI